MAMTPSGERTITERVRVTLLENVGAPGDVPHLQVVEMTSGALALLATEGEAAEVVGPRVTRDEAHKLARTVLEGVRGPDALFRLALAVIALTADQRRMCEFGEAA